jgi:S-adenosylmethionine hydrolase
VGPDNGILAPTLRFAAPAEVHRIDPGLLRLARRGTTFDGRDVFAPAAARLSGGAALADLGPPLADIVDLAPFDPVREPQGWSGEVIRVDRFGNVVTAVEETFLRRTFGPSWSRIRVRAGGRSVEGVRAAYEEVTEGALLLTIGGSGTLEICRNRGRAAEELGLQGGSRILFSAPEDSGVESERGEAEGVENTGADSAREEAQG